ncbi:MAG: tetratricopeptide repeat protein [Candidatus Manganitrophus sp.]|nr:tetratricopeptide repeat protein [Candidatus Manganitrophus sp.]
MAHFADHDLQQAKSAFSEALNQNPKDVRARTAIAELHLQARSFDLAMTESERAIELDPSNIKALMVLGDASASKGEIKKGESSYQQIIKLAPNEPIGYYKLGLLRRGQRRDQEALTFFEKALSLNSDHVDALAQIVTIDFSRGDSEKALKRVTTQVDAAPKNPAFYNLLAKVYIAKKDFKKAEESYQRAIELDPNYLASYVDLGNLYVQGKQFDQAIRKLDEAIKVNPNLPQIYMTRGSIYEAQQKHDQAMSRL